MQCSGCENPCVQVTLKLCTNIEPRHGGRLDMSSLLWTSGTAGRPWEYTGPASLLKSALQKNVRRGRAEEAVRYLVAETLIIRLSLLLGVLLTDFDLQESLAFRQCQPLGLTSAAVRVAEHLQVHD